LRSAPTPITAESIGEAIKGDVFEPDGLTHCACESPARYIACEIQERAGESGDRDPVKLSALSP
jgi:hypothetical protein